MKFLMLIPIFLPSLVKDHSMSVRGADVKALTELSINELLKQKNTALRDGRNSQLMANALPLKGNFSVSGFDPIGSMQIKGMHKLPARKTFFDYEDDYDEDGYRLPKKKSKIKFTKLFEVSVTALSFLAFGSYLLCLLVGVMKQRSTDALAAVGTTVSPQILLQQILNANKPLPLRIPTSSFAGRKKRTSSPYKSPGKRNDSLIPQGKLRSQQEKRKKS